MSVCGSASWKQTEFTATRYFCPFEFPYRNCAYAGIHSVHGVVSWLACCCFFLLTVFKKHLKAEWFAVLYSADKILKYYSTFNDGRLTETEVCTRTEWISLRSELAFSRVLLLHITNVHAHYYLLLLLCVFIYLYSLKEEEEEVEEKRNVTDSESVNNNNNNRRKVNI